MSRSQGHALSAIAFQLAAELESYQEQADALIRAPFDPDLYQRVSRHIDSMRMYAAALPSVSVAWVEVLIRHFELTHALWRLQHDGKASVELAALRKSLFDAVDRLSQKCTQLMPSA
jgi:hypothetical protein